MPNTGIIVFILKCAIEVGLLVVTLALDKPILHANKLYLSISSSLFIASKDSQFPSIYDKR